MEELAEKYRYLLERTMNVEPNSLEWKELIEVASRERQINPHVDRVLADLLLDIFKLV